MISSSRTTQRTIRGPLLIAVVVIAATASTGCNYSFQAGSFPPPHVRTIAIEPFDNESERFEVASELYEELVRSLPSALGVRQAGLESADAVVRGSVTRYDVQAPNYRAGAGGQPAQVLQREVRISISVQIVDRIENVILWESNSETAQGLFAEGAPEEEGRRAAIELLVQAIVDGAQSNW
jgi:outer membrane lipopolysaccharide assembly protein LptE/RlpB